jgi:enamine deaminase RidA (YjgF/YER057c/UK114 family)
MNRTRTREMASHGLRVEETWGYAQAIVADDLVHVAGQVPRDAEGRPVVGSFAVAFERTIENVSAALDQVGSSLADLAYAQVHLKADDLEEGIRLFRERFEPWRPAATFVTITALNHPDYALEISATAASGTGERLPIHVENPLDERLGRSAAVCVGDVIFVSGRQSGRGDPAEPGADGFPAGYGRALRDVVAVVETAGGAADDVVSLQALSTELPSSRELYEVARAHEETLGIAPAHSLVQVPRLSGPGVTEVSAIAIRRAR